MFIRPLRLAARVFQHYYLSKEIGAMGYEASEGYCFGGASLYAYARLTGNRDSFQEWVKALPNIRNLAKNTKTIAEKREKNESLSKEEKTFLAALPGDPRVFLDNLVLLQRPELLTHQPFLLKPIKHHQHALLDSFSPYAEEKAGHVISMFHDAVIKTQKELQAYISDLGAILQSKEKEEEKSSIVTPYVILLSSLNHAIVITPDTLPNEWELFDMNQLPFVTVPAKALGEEVRQTFLLGGDGYGHNFFRDSKEFISAWFLEKYTACSVRVLTLHTNPTREKISKVLEEFKAHQPITTAIAQRKTRYGISLAQMAASEGLLSILKILSEQCFVDLLEVDRYGQTLLMCAAFSGHAEVTQFILQKYKELKPYYINAEDSYHRTAFFFAAWTGDLKTVQALLEYGANPIIANKAKTTPLMMACEQGHVEVVELIAGKLSSIDRCVSLNSKDSLNRTAVFFAAARGHEQIIRILAKYGTDLNPDCPGPLAAAIQFGHVNVIQVLAEYKVPMDSTFKDDAGNEHGVGHLLVDFGRIQVARYFAKLGINFITQETPTSAGQPIAWAIRRGKWNIVARMFMSFKCENVGEFGDFIARHKAELLKAYEYETGFAPKEVESNLMQIAFSSKLDNFSAEGKKTAVGNNEPSNVSTAEQARVSSNASSMFNNSSATHQSTVVQSACCINNK